MNRETKDTLEGQLIKNLRTNLNELQELLNDCSGEWGYEDPIYRYYHQSFKVYNVQKKTVNMVFAFEKLLPGYKLNNRFMEIIKNGTGKTFDLSHNSNWSEHTRPILEAFFHAKFFLEMLVSYGVKYKEEDPQGSLDSGWAAVLHLYYLR